MILSEDDILGDFEEIIADDIGRNDDIIGRDETDEDLEDLFDNGEELKELDF